MSTPTEAPRPRAVLVGVQLAGVTDAEQRSSLTELKRLCETLGFEVVGEVTQKRQGLGAATLLGEGKLAELAGWTGGTGVVRKGPPGKKGTEETESAGREKPPLVPVDSDRLVRDLISTLEDWQSPKADVAIEGTLPVVLGHAGFLTQAISNQSATR
jgi:GTP-binding protein HflX